MNLRALFYKHLAQTSAQPLALEIEEAEGSWIVETSGRRFLDLIGGISVCNLGHRHPRILQAIQDQSSKYLHVLVYGELIQGPQVRYASQLCDRLPASLNSVYFTNSGAEATEGAMKLAKRATGRTQIVAFRQSYHGSTQGALSLMGDEYWKNAFRPLLPDILQLEFNRMEDLSLIGNRTAAVVVESIQAERGVVAADPGWFQALRRKCTQTGALLVLDEIQTGFGRTGTCWHLEQLDITPDILLLGKALGGSLPLGAFLADQALMRTLSDQPVLGHITTFGGHPLCCAAGKAAFEVLCEGRLWERARLAEQQFQKGLKHRLVKSIRSRGLLMALEFENQTINRAVIDRALQKGLLTDWFLFAPQCLRLAPSLLISDSEIHQACEGLQQAMDEVEGLAFKGI